MFRFPHYSQLPSRSSCDDPLEVDCHGAGHEETKGLSGTPAIAKRRVLSLLAAAVFIVLSGAVLCAYRHRAIITSISMSNTIESCGTTPAEARARGCLFELHNFAWVPAACYDHELADAWDADEGWLFSHNMEGTDLIPKEVALRGELPAAWVPWSQHLAHCVLIWRKFQRAVSFGWPMDNWTSSYSHTDHCATNLMRHDLDKAGFNSLLYLKYPACDFRWRTPITPAEFKASLPTEASSHKPNHS